MGTETSIIAAIACSAAAGKNPWIPLGLLFLLAAPEEVPGFVLEPELHGALHGLADPGLLYTLATVFLVLSALESLADKLPFVQSWLVPISTAWRPFAGVAVAAILAWAGIQAAPAASAPTVESADMMGAMPVAAIALAVGSFSGWLATVAKTGIRLMLSMLPVPGLRLAHSFLDDFFALGATIAGLAFADSSLVAFLAILYVAIGLLTGPLLARLAWIHMRIVWATIRKASGDRNGAIEAPPWLAKRLDAAGIESPTLLPAYTYRAPVVGRCRSGFLVLAGSEVWFACRAFFRPRVFRVTHEQMTRLGLAETTTSRVVVLCSAPDGTETRFTLFPADAEDTVVPLEEAAARSSLARVDPQSDSARRGLPGLGTNLEPRPPRYVAAARAGSLRAQGITTIVCAVLFGVLSAGTFIPIGVGYALSPFGSRFGAGLLLSAYLTFCVFVTVGIGWPAAVLYAVLLNVLALRDMARQALKAKVDGYVDTKAFLPPVCEHVWVTADRLETDAHRWSEDVAVVTDGSWRQALEPAR